MAGRYLPVAVFAGLVAAIQLTTHVTGSSFHLTQLTMTAYYSLLIVGLCLLIGYAGQISLGHAGFFAIGGYLSAFLTTHDLGPHAGSGAVVLLKAMGILVKRQGLYGGEILSVHPWAACAVAVLSATAVAFLLGGPVLKLKGHYLAMATLGFGLIVYRIVLGTESLGAADGISDVPGFPLAAGWEIAGKASSKVSNYYLAWGLVAAGVALLLNLIDSRVGRALTALHGAEDASEAVGIPTARYKLGVFVLSAVYASLAGVLLTHYNGGIAPSEASVMKSIRYVAIVAIGGMANLWGALSMSLLLNYLSLRGYFGTLDDAVFGVILIAIMLLAPEGLLNPRFLGDAKKRLWGGKAEGERP
jgi:branched-chain amino acid transport system permease protein